MKKSLHILFLIAVSFYTQVKAQNNILPALRMQPSFQTQENPAFSLEKNTYAFANPEKVHEIQHMNAAMAKSSGIGGLTVAGIIVAAVGVALLAGGISMVKKADGVTYYSNENGQEEGDLGGGLGAVMAAGGGILTLGGTAMIIIGAVTHKKRR